MHDQVSSEMKQAIKDTILHGSLKDIVSMLQQYHEADVAEVLEDIPYAEQLEFFRRLRPEQAVNIFEETDISVQIKLIKDFKLRTASKILGNMYTDDITDLLSELSEEDKEKAIELLESLPPEDFKHVSELLAYPEDTAGGLMDTDYISIPENLTIREALERIKKQNPPESEISFFIYIVSENNKLVAMTNLRNLLVTDWDQKVKTIRETNVISVSVDTDQEEVARVMSKYDLYVLPVVDHQGRLRGVITADDVMDVVEEETTEDIYKLSGTSEIEEEKLLHGRLLLAVKSRIPWLLLTLVGGFISGTIINHYASSLTSTATVISLPILMSFVPLLMGIGGNVGNQSCTIIVRGIATGHIKHGENIRHIFREFQVGLLIGLFTGSVTAVLAFTWRRNPLIGIIVGLAMWANITTAAIIGTMLPLVFRRLGVDPAVASAPFISTTIDITGLIIYFTFVTVLSVLLI